MFFIFSQPIFVTNIIHKGETFGPGPRYLPDFNTEGFKLGNLDKVWCSYLLYCKPLRDKFLILIVFNYFILENKQEKYGCKE
jgi:hypothetical protein